MAIIGKAATATSRKRRNIAISEIQTGAENNELNAPLALSVTQF
jgi:hypothetical protein